ncbi:MAG: cyanophycinase [Firmicutes bacterium]|nr:cyanophycinase [Bacillota bacterium]
MKLDRLGDITSELSANLVKSIVLPGGFLEWLSKPLAERLRDFKSGASGARSGEAADPVRIVVPAGPLVLIGGTPAPDEAIVAMIHLAGGRAAKLAVVPVATQEHARAAEEAVRYFARFGMRNIQVLDLTTRERAESPEWCADLAECDAVFLCGETAAIGLAVLRGSACARTLQQMMAAGKPVAGMGGGAAILSDRLVIEQDGHEVLTAGLGLAPSLVIDAYFTQESRFGHLVKALNKEGATSLMGVGLDAGASVVIKDGEAKVLGESSVTFLDARESTPASDQANYPPGAMCGLKVHVLMDGFGMNLRTRKPVGPPVAQAVNER